jgi:Flp pilus assembly protein TadB
LRLAVLEHCKVVEAQTGERTPISIGNYGRDGNELRFDPHNVAFANFFAGVVRWLLIGLGILITAYFSGALLLIRWLLRGRAYREPDEPKKGYAEKRVNGQS